MIRFDKCKDKKLVLEIIGDNAEAVKRYKALVEGCHAPGGYGNTFIYLSWIKF